MKNLNNNKSKPVSIHVWAPELFAVTGGIQAFSIQLIKALGENFGADSLRVLVKSDHAEFNSIQEFASQINSSGFWPMRLRTLIFSLKCLFYAWYDSSQLIISTHIHFGPLAWIVKKLFGTRFILVAHGLEIWRLNKLSRHMALKKADAILSVSRFTRDHLIHELGLDPQQISILSNTFSPENFAILPKSATLLRKYDIPDQAPIIMTVCRLAEAERYKGYDQVILALPKILETYPDTRYVLVGKGPDRIRVENLIESVGVKESVILAGFVPDIDLVNYYNLCDLFAMPSKAEGFGIVYLEALACGKPVLAGNKDGSRDAILDGELGILVDPDSIEELSDNILEILSGKHPHPLIYQPEKLRQRVTESFGFASFKKAVYELISPFLS